MNNAIIKNIVNDIKDLKQRLSQLTTLSARSEITGGFSRVLYADLPTPGKKSRTYYCLDARLASEGAGVGTGCLVVDNGSAWVYVDRPEVVVVI